MSDNRLQFPHEKLIFKVIENFLVSTKMDTLRYHLERPRSIDPSIPKTVGVGIKDKCVIRFVSISNDQWKLIFIEKGLTTSLLVISNERNKVVARGDRVLCLGSVITTTMDDHRLSIMNGIYNDDDVNEIKELVDEFNVQYATIPKNKPNPDITGLVNLLDKSPNFDDIKHHL